MADAIFLNYFIIFIIIVNSMNICKKNMSFVSFMNVPISMVKYLACSLKSYSKVFLFKKAIFYVKIQNFLRISSNYERNIITLFLVCFLFLCRSDKISEITSKQIFWKGHLIDKNIICICFDICINYVCKESAWLYVFSRIFFYRKWLDVIERISHFSKMSWYYWSCILFSKFSANKLCKFNSSIKRSLP